MATRHAVALPAHFMKIPARLNITSEVLDVHVSKDRADRPALYCGDQVFTYRTLQQRVNQFGNALKGLGLRRGDRFLIRSRNCPEFVFAMLAGMKIGAVPMPTNTLFRRREIEHILNNSEARLALTMPDLLEPIVEVRKNTPALERILVFGPAMPGCPSFAEALEGASSELRVEDTAADDLAFMIYTSGTTGAPKGVQHAHRWIRGVGDPARYVVQQFGDDDVTFFPNELSFIFALGCNCLFPLSAGAAAVLWPGRFNPVKCLQAIERYRVTQLVAVPTMLRMILNEVGIESRYDLSSLKWCLTSGEPLPAATYQEFQERFGIEIFDGMGQTEFHLFVGNWHGQKVKPGSMGRPYAGHRVAVLDDDDRPCAAGDVGRLVVDRNAPGLSLGYLKMEELWNDRFKGPWFYTGDLAHIDEDGYYWYASRSDDMIKTRGYLVSPREVESKLMDHPAVLEAGVVGVPDKVIGKRIRAYVVPRTGHEPSELLRQELLECCRASIALYKVPREIEFMSELPKTATGKIMRRTLRGEERAC